MNSLTNYHLERIYHSTKELIDLIKELKVRVASIEEKIQKPNQEFGISLKDFSLGE